MQLLATTHAANPEIKEKSAYNQAAFLIGWAGSMRSVLRAAGGLARAVPHSSR